ncbi:RNA polymerase sigma factor [Flavihumibacter fluvii]|uniref:RNA polymerase sigma factor n=1 Tax=Flavihumibacter fluvii TaxID=2838157 RepID=UPI001BDE4928|nr:sigma-70 family RNA polymerase sigma factor [Flavihumibacter fluvii]ULQ52572.1 sigma-70 family RNA polymerase sigma factor [Flavihumibacter fluvii]
MQLGKLIYEAKNGSSAAQKCLFDEMADKMLATCYRYVKNQEDAEELMLNGFFKFFRNLQSFTFEEDAALFGYVKKIMVNECLMFLRKKKVFTIVAETAAVEVPLEEDALNNLSAAEILQLVLQLPVGYRTVFNLNVIEGYSHKEIANLMDISTGTSKSQLSKARVLLQKLMTQKGIEYARQKSQ